MKKLLLISALCTATMAQAQQSPSDTLDSKGTIRIQITKEVNGKVTRTDTTFEIGDEHSASLFLQQNGKERGSKALIRLLEDEESGILKSQDFRMILPPAAPTSPGVFRQYSFSYNDVDREGIMESVDELLREHGFENTQQRNVIREIEIIPDKDQRRKMKKAKKKRIIIIEES